MKRKSTSVYVTKRAFSWWEESETSFGKTHLGAADLKEQ